MGRERRKKGGRERGEKRWQRGRGDNSWGELTGRELSGGRGGVERKWRELVERDNGERARRGREWGES